MSDEINTPSGDPRPPSGQQMPTGGPGTSTLPEPDRTDDAAPGASGFDDGTPGGTDRPGTKARHRRRRHLLPWVVIIVIAVLIAAVVRLFFVQTFFVPSSSMYPTLREGDRMLVLKEGYSITRGAILVFRHPPLDTRCGPGDDDLVKRVIGLPGEEIWSKGNTVYINGKPLAEPWLPKHDPMGTMAVPKQKVPANSYYMMGDNRAFSCDSRYWGPLPRSLVVGRVFLVIWRNGHPVFDVI